MYSIKFGPEIVFIISICFTIIYSGELFVIWTAFSLLNKKLNSQCYTVPAIIVFTFFLLIFLGLCCSENFFSFTFNLFGIFLGYLLYIFLTSVFIKIIYFCVDIPSIFGIIILILLPVIICIYGYINAKKTKIVKHSLKYEGYKGKTTILHLSDIHLGTLHQKSSVERIVEETIELKPDIVVITGDLADGSLRVKEEWLRPFNKLTMPILYVTGNHEMMNPKTAMLEEVEKTNIKYIGNYGRYQFKNINFIGMDFGLNLKVGLEDVEQEKNIPNVLLCHVPSMKPEDLIRNNIFLFLGGHTHGGQLFPLQIPAYFANVCFSGLYSDKDKKHHVFVSEGVNNALVPMRIGSKRTFALITITGDDEFE